MLFIINMRTSKVNKRIYQYIKLQWNKMVIKISAAVKYVKNMSKKKVKLFIKGVEGRTQYVNVHVQYIERQN